MDALTLPLRSLLDPLGAVPRAVETRRWVTGVALASLLSAAAGAVVGVRLDPSAAVLTKLGQAGELAKASDREVAEAVEQAQRVWLVSHVASGLLLVPVMALLLAVVLKVAAWLLSREALFTACLTAASLALLPLAVHHGIELLAALRAPTLTPADAEALVPSSLAALWPVALPWSRVLGAVDLFNLWSAATLGLGFAAASGWRAWRGALFGLFLYLLFAAAFFVGLPGLMAGAVAGGGHP